MKHRFDPAEREKKTRLATHVLSRRPTTINLNDANHAHDNQPCPTAQTSTRVQPETRSSQTSDRDGIRYLSQPKHES